ncbi:bifunctional folylpolyglutamate synthase/dihydrofolate synthase [Streptococcus thermophilus]|uniref:bifunctional folylpolyglutamate synthase/dihydrofolate synthase n=1 Tax=Streptococcus thermophilus TaxID=1308 RepID=UPI001107E285|nr:folylpolyglutamate synthase/dihydrofolate synthase family protein [Streptococcus thermophilus]MBO1156334.1 bifunctional folylpolyglutamate synthase/dihydrofolate synthase [Streptococcus thermophilus]MBO1161281.1 bifunctional folylpolyglutamate synthase/dihydrofolate synthase [Streptococcus thermophilus]MCS9982093.1 bifunctional folylpolyglutamate synthase/dihydrofolate synthase [Streptococcus thermophilus]MCS9985820.1 bifunctional folylpolyglutamate synthase/dihydrofolate synthase [Streptoco
MIYQEALDWIHGQLKFGIKPGLERMAWMLEELGNPQDNLKAVHIVGTNGKGSTVNALQTIFSQAGYEVGTFTSPYIIDFKERISINGQMISEENLLGLVERVKPVVERLPKETEHENATEFEIITVLMFLYFGQVHPVDIAFIEAGMGGLHDSTNLFSPLVVICPSIGLDHQAVLGNTHAEIATEKAGVLKNGASFIYATDRTDVRDVFKQKANEEGSKTYELGKDFTAEGSSHSFDFIYKEQRLEGIALAMAGQHQVANASLAIMASLLLQKDYPKVTPELIKDALAHASWLGRTEFLMPNLMIDGAHNNESVKVLIDLLRSEYADKDIELLFAAIDTKPIDSMLAQLESVGDLTVTSFEYPNSVKLDKYPVTYKQVSDFQTWIEEHVTANDDKLYVITGSLYFISQVRKWILEQGRAV